MTIAKLNNRLAQIRAFAATGQHRNAAEAERKLLLDVLRDIASGGDPSIIADANLARRALAVIGIDFERWPSGALE